MYGDTEFKAGGYDIALKGDELWSLMEVLREMPTWIRDLEIALRDDREILPRTDEDAAMLLAVLEVHFRRGTATPAMKRLHYALRQRRTPEPDARAA